MREGFAWFQIALSLPSYTIGLCPIFCFGGDDYNYILFWHLFPPVDVHSANPFFFYHWNTSTTCRRVLTGILNVCFVVHWIMTAISLLLQFLFPLRHTAFEEKTTEKGHIGGRLASSHLFKSKKLSSSILLKSWLLNVQCCFLPVWFDEVFHCFMQSFMRIFSDLRLASWALKLPWSIIDGFMFENPNPTDAVGMDKHSEFVFFFSCSFDSCVLCLMSFDHATSPCFHVHPVVDAWNEPSQT